MHILQCVYADRKETKRKHAMEKTYLCMLGAEARTAKAHTKAFGKRDMIGLRTMGKMDGIDLMKVCCDRRVV